jgi:hypothetical protein
MHLKTKATLFICIVAHPFAVASQDFRQAPSFGNSIAT